MNPIISISRAFKTSLKQIGRGGWLSLASISIMTLAFLVLSIFSFLAFLSLLFLRYIENSPHIYVFFKVGTEEASISSIKNEWEKQTNIDFIEYTSEEEAKEEFARHYEINRNPLIEDEIRDPNQQLPASLGIRLNSIQDAQTVIDLVEQEQDLNPDVFAVRYSENTINNLKEAVFWLQFLGGSFMILLTIVIFLFTLLTVEFRTYSRSKEIEIMQLVGGSLWYIRLPFILEGAIYGAVGAFVSNLILASVSIFTWYSPVMDPTKTFFLKFFGNLDWPEITIPIAIIIFLSTLIVGFIVGAINSLIAIIKYIK